MNHGHPVPLLELRHVSVTEGLSGRPLVRDVSFSLQRGHCLGIVGESGSGKSLLCRALLGLLPSGLVRSGQLHFDGRDLGRLDPAGWRELRGTGMAVILQQAMTAFDPLRPLGKQLAGTLRDTAGLSASRAREAVREALQRVGLPETVLHGYPHQLSGGMRQRVVIAIALSCDPDLLICDEPTTALDVTIQAKILELIRSIQKERGISVIYITHDLGVVAKVADYVDVMYAGKIVETGTIDEIFYDPRHPYTWGLLSAMPDLDTADERLYTIPGSPPNLLHEKAGDAFAPRNKYALEIDDEIDPPMFKISDTHFAATWLLDPRAPKVEMPPELKDRVARMSAEAKKIEEAE